MNEDDPGTASPYELLLDMERRCRDQAAPLPEREERRTDWRAVAFSLAGRWFIAPLDEVSEILVPTPLTRVPGVRRWVLGLANVRGNLLPVMDLADYLLGQPGGTAKGGRILVVNHSGVLSGLLVDRVSGMRHFLYEERREECPEVPNAVRPYLEGSVQVGDELWPVFSMHRLAESPLFMHVAAV